MTRYRLLSIRAPSQLAVNRPDNCADRQVAATPGNRFTSALVRDPPLHQRPLVPRSALASAVDSTLQAGLIFSLCLGHSTDGAG